MHRVHLIRFQKLLEKLLGVEAPPVSLDVVDQAAELTKGKVAEGGAATDAAVKKAVVGPAQ